MTIAEVAAVSGLSAHTLRYYERIGLLDPVARVHVGISVDELRELLIQVAPYAGFPAAINAMRRVQALVE